MKMCGSCGTENENADPFCKNCGGELKDNEANKSTTKKRKFKTKSKVVLLLILVLVVVSSGILVYLNAQTEKRGISTENIDRYFNVDIEIVDYREGLITDFVSPGLNVYDPSTATAIITITPKIKGDYSYTELIFESSDYYYIGENQELQVTINTSAKGYAKKEVQMTSIEYQFSPIAPPSEYTLSVSSAKGIVEVKKYFH